MHLKNNLKIIIDVQLGCYHQDILSGSFFLLSDRGYVLTTNYPISIPGMRGCIPNSSRFEILVTLNLKVASLFCMSKREHL